MAEHDKGLLVLIVLSFIIFAGTLTFNILVATAPTIDLYRPDNIHALMITLTGWTFQVWAGIYACNGLWLIYMVSTIFRRNNHGYIYCTTKIHPKLFHFLWILNNISVIGCIFLWDQRCLVPALMFLVSIPFSCCVMLVMSYQNCFHHGLWLYLHHPAELWCIRILVHNGLMIYAAWTSIVTFIAFGRVLENGLNFNDFSASLAALCMILFGLLFWFSLETFVFENYVRYTFTVYPTAMIVLLGIFFNNRLSYEMPSKITIFIGIILGVSAAALVFHLVLLFICHKLRPLYVFKELDVSDGHRSSPDSAPTDVNGCWTTGLTENNYLHVETLF